MLTNFNWVEVQSSRNGKTLPKGGYVICITDCTNDEQRERLTITWDVAEGDCKDYYSDEFGKSHPEKHQFTVSHSERACRLFKHFLDCLEKSNPAFSIKDWQRIADERQVVAALIGMKVGVSWGDELYTYRDNDGVAREGKGRTFPRWYTVDEIRSGRFELPADTDNRDNTLVAEIERANAFAGSNQPAASQTGAYDDLPF